MNKREYHKLLELRKSQEEMLYHLIRLTGKSPRELMKHIPIHPKRIHYILNKWEKDRYEYGVNLELGWLTFDRKQDYENKDLWK